MGLVQDPFHLGAVILDKIIGDLKAKLPFLNKKKGSEDDSEEIEESETDVEIGSDDTSDDKTSVARSSDSSDEEESVDNSLIGKIKAQLPFLQKFLKKKETEEVEGDEEAPKEKKRKKPNLIVIVGAVALIAFLLLSESGDETPTPEVDPASMLKKRPKKKPKPKADTAETKPAETATEEKKPEETAVGTETKPEETVTVSPTETPTVETPPETVPAETIPAETTTAETPSTETPVDTTVTVPTEEEPITVEAVPSDSLPTTETAVTDTVNGETPSIQEDLTDQILKDLENQAKTSEAAPVQMEYVTPPNYENVGRGLVYNCTGKHWACIDAPSYKKCEDNSGGNKTLKKKAECYPFNVYETQSGCEKMQNRMVSSSAKTQFCNSSL